MKYFKMKNEIEELKRQNLISIKKNLKLERENEELKKEIKELKKKQKESNVINISMKKEDVDSIVKKVTENIIGKQEHKCTPECFERHVLKPIQSDIYKKFGDDIVTRRKNLIEMVQFVETWRIKLLKEYPFLKDLYTRDFGELTAVY